MSAAQAPEPWKNPSYPQRVHLHERAHWQEVLERCEERIAAALEALGTLEGTSSNRAGLERLYGQMLGCRDQVADAVRRLPMETGELYAEDKHRLEEAVAALERLSDKWAALAR